MKLSKTLVVLFLVGGLVLGTALPALATSSPVSAQPAVSYLPDKDNGKEHWFDGKVKVVKGEVTDISGNVIKVDSKDVIVTDNQTRYTIPGLGKEGSLADIEKGMEIVALGYEKDGKFYALQIAVIPGRPAYQHHVGTVTAFSYNETAGGSITIEEKSGKTVTPVTFDIIGGKFKVLPQGATVKVGDLVTVISHRDPAHNHLIASGVVVHQPKPTPQPWAGLKRITGTINNISENTTDNKTITIGTTVLNFNDKTVFVLRGVLAVKIGQEATAFYSEQDSTRLAKAVLVGINLPDVLEQLKEKLED